MRTGISYPFASANEMPKRRLWVFVISFAPEPKGSFICLKSSDTFQNAVRSGVHSVHPKQKLQLHYSKTYTYSQQTIYWNDHSLLGILWLFCGRLLQTNSYYMVIWLLVCNLRASGHKTEFAHARKNKYGQGLPSTALNLNLKYYKKTLDSPNIYAYARLMETPGQLSPKRFQSPFLRTFDSLPGCINYDTTTRT